MKTVDFTEFETHRLRLVDELPQTREPIEITKRGKRVAVVSPPFEPRGIDWTSGAPKDGVEWEAMRRSCNVGSGS